MQVPAKHVSWGSREERTISTGEIDKAARIGDTFQKIRTGQKLQNTGFTLLEAMHYKNELLTEHRALELYSYITTDSLSCEEGREDLRMKLTKIDGFRLTDPRVGKEIESLLGKAGNSGSIPQSEVMSLIKDFSHEEHNGGPRRIGKMQPKKLFD